MKRRRILALFFLGGVACAVLLWRREPRYGGKGLTEWLHLAYGNWDGSPERDEAMDAVRKMGPKTLPYLLQAVTYTESVSRKKVVEQLRGAPGGSRWVKLVGGGENDRVYPAVLGFRALGPAAAPAVPRLVDLMNSTDSGMAYRGMQALGAVGKPGIPPLLAAVKDEHRSDRATASMFLAVAYANGGEMDSGIAVMRECLEDRDPAVVRGAVIGLFQSPVRPDFKVPAFINLARHKDMSVRYFAIEGLGRLGRAARPAIPALQAAVEDSNDTVRQAATNALRKVAPEVLEGK